MNIFILDEDPIMSAKFYCDKHIPKMVVELYQQLGSAVIRHGATPDMMPLTKKGTPLRGGYHNHPCTRWVGDSRANFLWASYHAAMLCEEYTKRFDKTHFCEHGIEKLYELHKLIPDGELTPFAQAMPDEYRDEDAVVAYRNYYMYDKSRFAQWNRGRDAPYWWLV